jgi:hypothetical protein
MAPQFWEMTDHGLQFNQQRFAECIIRECAGVVRRSILSGSGVDPDTYTGTVNTVQELYRHFGVEE